MGCNCKKDKTELSKRKDIRKKTKEAIATIKRLWQESENNTITTSKNYDELEDNLDENKFIRIVRLTTETLAGIPSIVYGLFGYLIFVKTMQMGYSLLSGALTLAIMVLPTIMRTTEEALISVPLSFREGSFGLGAGKLRTIFCIILPSATSGILSGIILSIGRIVGETAALIYTAGTVTGVAGLFSSGRTLSVHMYSLLSEGLYTDQAYATAVVLLVFVLTINYMSEKVSNKIRR